MRHEVRRFVERVDYRTSPGWIDGPLGRRHSGLPHGGPIAVITNMAVLHFDEVSKEMVLASHHPGVTIDAVLAQTGFPLATAGAVETEPPLEDEIRLLHEVIDPEALFLPRRG
jgi:glutaconate CoA-transferase subunit B